MDNLYLFIEDGKTLRHFTWADIESLTSDSELVCEDAEIELTESLCKDIIEHLGITVSRMAEILFDAITSVASHIILLSNTATIDFIQNIVGISDKLRTRAISRIYGEIRADEIKIADVPRAYRFNELRAECDCISDPTRYFTAYDGYVVFHDGCNGVEHRLKDTEYNIETTVDGFKMIHFEDGTTAYGIPSKVGDKLEFYEFRVFDSILDAIKYTTMALI